MLADTIAGELLWFRSEQAPAALADKVQALVPTLVEWIKRHGPEFADASGGDPVDVDESELDTLSRGRGLRRVPRRERGRGSARRQARADTATRLRLTVGLMRSCLGALGVPGEVIDAALGRPDGPAGWIARVFDRIRGIDPWEKIPEPYKADALASHCVVAFVRNDLRKRPGELREFAEGLNRGE